MAGGQVFLDGKVILHHGDSRDVLKTLADNSVDSVVTDPPYALVSIVKRFANSPRSEATENVENPYGRTGRGFMGQKWDTGETAFAVEFWREVMRVLKPGGHVIAASGTRTYHRLAVAIEDAGFEIRDMISWLYGSGFPKSHDVLKGIDRAAGADREIVAIGKPVKRMIPGADQHKTGWEKDNGREFVPSQSVPATPEAEQWQGWGTALKPACEPWVLARKPLVGTVAANVLMHGVGALNIDGCRVGDTGARNNGRTVDSDIYGKLGTFEAVDYGKGRWPANVIHDGSDEAVAGFPQTASGEPGIMRKGTNDGACYGAESRSPGTLMTGFGDSGSAARFFYTAKADADDRAGSKHPTVKPLDLMQYLCRLVTPPGGTVLDPFAGTGTTGEAAWREGFNAILIEREDQYAADIAARLNMATLGPEGRSFAIAKRKEKERDAGPLFNEAAA